MQSSGRVMAAIASADPCPRDRRPNTYRAGRAPLGTPSSSPYQQHPWTPGSMKTCVKAEVRKPLNEALRTASLINGRSGKVLHGKPRPRSVCTGTQNERRNPPSIPMYALCVTKESIMTEREGRARRARLKPRHGRAISGGRHWCSTPVTWANATSLWYGSS